DAAEAGDHVERVVGPRQGTHVADPDVGVGCAVAGDGDESWRRVDPRATRTASRRQLDRQAGAAGDVEHSVADADAETFVHADVLSTVARFGKGRELDRPTPPTLVDHLPLLHGALPAMRTYQRPVGACAGGKVPPAHRRIRSNNSPVRSTVRRSDSKSGGNDERRSQWCAVR